MPGIGARALADYLTSKNILTRAFDTESPRGTLKRFHGGMTEVVDIDSTADQMKILDTLNTAQVKVSIIDTRAGALARTLKALHDVGFFEAVRERWSFSTSPALREKPVKNNRRLSSRWCSTSTSSFSGLARTVAFFRK